MQFANETPWPVYAGEVKTKRGFAAQLKKQPLPGHWRPVVSYPNRLNQSRRGTMLVVVLGLLVALFVIGTSFSFVTLTERRAAQNYLDRQRALDLALDGVEYSIARLRAEATTEHYVGIGPSVPGLDGTGQAYDPRRYALHPLDSSDPAVSWAKDASKTSIGGTTDGNWVDFNGDNNRSGEEASYGTDKNQPAFAKGVTGFHADGINVNQIKNDNVQRAGDNEYGPSGTYEELGDYFRVRAVDAASLLNLNNFKDEDSLAHTLLILGEAIDAWLNNGKPSGQNNPLPSKVVDEFVAVAKDLGFIFTSKEQLRPIWNVIPDSDKMYDLAMNFITVNSWVDTSYRDFCESNNNVDEDTDVNPLKLPDVRLWREGFSRDDQNGRDGWPDWQPTASSSGKAPININTAPKPVLVCLFANIAANSRLLFFQKQSQITQNDQLYKDKFNQDVPIQRSGTTDLGRQNNRSDLAGTGILDEAEWYPSGAENRAIFQLVPIGPISTLLGSSGPTSANTPTGNEDYASNLADEVIRLRASHAFTSWQDFDARFCRGILLGLNDTNRNSIKVPDLIGVARGDIQRPNPVSIASAYPTKLLPDPKNCNHPANPLNSGDTAMTGSDFRAWYWKSCVDMIRASLCPSNLTSRYNADYPMHMNVDRMDLTHTNAPVCFSSMGIYEIVSEGEILAPEAGQETTTSTAPGERLPVARRQVRTTVQIYEVLRHSSQRDFMSPLTAETISQNKATSSQNTLPETMTSLTKNHTKAGPYSIDELTPGIWESNDGAQQQYLSNLDDGRNIGYKKPTPGEITTKDRVKGHNPYSAASGEFGYVTMDPRDETPFDDMRLNAYPLAFHARYNESLWARTKSQAFPTLKIEGVNSDQVGVDESWGHLPWTHDAAFDDFISSATPRSTEKVLATGASLTKEFDNADAGDEATRYSSLVPDGVFLRGSHLRPRAISSRLNLEATYGKRGLGRYPRLKILRYPCGSGGQEASAAANPFGPIRPVSWIGDNGPGVKDDGVDDSKQQGYVDPSSGPNDAQMRIRLVGGPSFRGTDDHNKDAEFHRQHRSNMPYYEGTVDFWIKWDLPPQGSDERNKVAALGELDPASHNFSGLFGCTAYGRFADSLTHNNPTATNRDKTADFEGVQFFVYKEPGGWLRFSRLYFSEAFGANVAGGATGSVPQNVVQFGTLMRRIFDEPAPLGGYTATNDICNDRGVANDNLGFLYARTDSWIELTEASYVSAGLGAIILRPHDWHRFTLSYNSNTDQPYRLWFDGKQVNGVEFYPDADINNPKGFRNDGRHAPKTDQALPTEEPSGSPGYDVYRTSCKLLEINPEDRLTVGCIFRRQPDLSTAGDYNLYYDNDPDQGDLDKPPRPVFKFDSNFVAVANATIDDFRVSSYVLPSGLNVQASQFLPYSRYQPQGGGEDCYYENGFLPVRASDGQLQALPVRLGTISWTELRPDWDPYEGHGINLAESSGIEMEWGVVDDYSTIKTGGSKYALGTCKYKGDSGYNTGAGTSDKDYWALGGMSLRGAVLPSGNKVGVFLYRAHFQTSTSINVNNVTPYLLDVTVTVLTPPRKISFVIEY
ncbi:MAG: hypothetical protein KDB82_17095 [Planctomycetes bacterium]|nr:hypothetical protein [Planctomycetota bacterium]